MNAAARTLDPCGECKKKMAQAKRKAAAEGLDVFLRGGTLDTSEDLDNSEAGPSRSHSHGMEDEDEDDVDCVGCHDDDDDDEGETGGVVETEANGVGCGFRSEDVEMVD